MLLAQKLKKKVITLNLFNLNELIQSEFEENTGNRKAKQRNNQK